MAALEKVRDAELTRRRRPPGAAGRLPPTSLGTRVDAVRERRSRAGTQEGVAELSDVGRNLSGASVGRSFFRSRRRSRLRFLFLPMCRSVSMQTGSARDRATSARTPIRADEV